MLPAFVVVEYTLKGPLGRISCQLLCHGRRESCADVGHLILLVKNFEDVGTVRVKLLQIEDVEQKRHDVLAHYRGVKSELDTGMSDQALQEVFELGSIIVKMLFYLIESRFVSHYSVKFIPAAVEDAASNVDKY